MKKQAARATKAAEIICWIDHSEPANKRVWDVPTHPADLYPCVVFTTGFVVSENDQIIEVSRDLSEHGSVGACLHILVKCIIYRKRIRVPGVPRRATRI